MEPAYRRECGFGGIGETDCNARGCCFDSSIPDTLHCFLTPACAIDAILRVECGFDGIQMDECLEIGCCWEDNPNAPRYCYQQASKGQLYRQSSINSQVHFTKLVYMSLYVVFNVNSFSHESCAKNLTHLTYSSHSVIIGHTRNPPSPLRTKIFSITFSEDWAKSYVTIALCQTKGWCPILGRIVETHFEDFLTLYQFIVGESTVNFHQNRSRILC